MSTIGHLVFSGPRSTLSVLHQARSTGNYALVWYAVAAIVLFALGATILLGAIVYCSLKGKMFGAVRQANWYTWWVGCF